MVAGQDLDRQAPRLERGDGLVCAGPQLIPKFVATEWTPVGREHHAGAALTRCRPVGPAEAIDGAALPRLEAGTGLFANIGQGNG